MIPQQTRNLGIVTMSEPSGTSDTRTDQNMMFVDESSPLLDMSGVKCDTNDSVIRECLKNSVDENVTMLTKSPATYPFSEVSCG